MSFWEEVAADTAEILGTAGETVQTVRLRIDGDPEIDVLASVSRLQQGFAAINSQNRASFDPETDGLTQGMLLIVCFDRARLAALGITGRPGLNWALGFPALPDEWWDFTRTDADNGNMLSVRFTRREAEEFGTGVGANGRRI